MENIIKTSIIDELQESFYLYGMAVNTDRAIPGVEDNCKPVHRRILYAMAQLGLTKDKAHRKCALIVGHVLGQLHPHGDTSVYDALVRLSQPWKMRYPLIDFQGSNGSIHGDPAAAMRYTEARLSVFGEFMLEDLKKNVVDFMPNYDGSITEPCILPSAIPEILIGSGMGIGVGMASSTPSHNLTEAINAILLYIDNPTISVEKVLEVMPGPDFATGGIIVNQSQLKEVYQKGRGTIKVRAKTQIFEQPNGESKIIISEVPFGMSIEKMIIKLKEYAIKKSEFVGIKDIVDYTDKDGIRIEVLIKKGYSAEDILEAAYGQRDSALQQDVSLNYVLLENGLPIETNLIGVISKYVKHRVNVVKRKAEFELEKLKAREEILQGFNIALANIDEIVQIIKSSADKQEAAIALVEKFHFTENQVEAILSMKLARLTNLEGIAIKNELEQILVDISTREILLSSEENLLKEVARRLIEIRDKFGDARKTLMSTIEVKKKSSVADMKKEKVEMDMIIYTLSNGNLVIKPKSAKKPTGIVSSFNIKNTERVIAFSKKGMFHTIPVEVIEETQLKYPKGVPLNVLCNINSLDDGILLFSKEIVDCDNKILAQITRQGLIKATILKDYSNGNRKAVKSITLNDGDEVVSVLIANEQDFVLVKTKMNKGLSFPLSEVRITGRATKGVKATTLDKGDSILSGEVSKEIASIKGKRGDKAKIIKK